MKYLILLLLLISRGTSISTSCAYLVVSAVIPQQGIGFTDNVSKQSDMIVRPIMFCNGPYTDELSARNAASIVANGAFAQKCPLWYENMGIYNYNVDTYTFYTKESIKSITVSFACP